MSIYCYNPEKALQRANELYELGKAENALECLFEALKNRKSKFVKQIYHESIIRKYLELCVELRKSQMAKDGLYCYRILCQDTNIKAWEDSILAYLELAESKTANIQKEIYSKDIASEDGEQNISPENLLKTVTNEDPLERNMPAMLLPCVKFLWESHRNCLDLLRGIQTEKLYHVVAQKAFNFCLKFLRKSELRKLNNIMKMHLTYVQKLTMPLNINNVEIVHQELDTAFVELESNIAMEIWQDAFRVLEDIHFLIVFSKQFQHSKVMAYYYNKISHVLWKGEKYLFHAAAVLRSFLLLKDQKKNLSSNEISKLASKVLLSVLAIPYPAVNSDFDIIAETDINVTVRKNNVLTSLLDLPKCPSRYSLIKEIKRLDIPKLAPKDFQDIFNAFEIEPEQTKIQLCIIAITYYVSNRKYHDFDQYFPLIHKNAVLRLLSVLSKTYNRVKISTLEKLAKISEATELEMILVESARRYGFPLRIDHKNMCVQFPSDLCIPLSEILTDEDESKSSSSSKNLKILSCIHSVLKKTVSQINPEYFKAGNKLITEKKFKHYFHERDSERQILLRRKHLIEKHKEHIENIKLKKEEEEKKLLADKTLQHEAAEKEKLLREAKERNMLRLRQEQEEIKQKILMEKMETFKKEGQIIASEDLAALDPQISFSKQMEQLNKKRREFSKKLERQERRLDHFERAKRTEEITLLIEESETEKKEVIKMWKENQENKINEARNNRVRDLQRKIRMLEIKKDLNNFLKLIKQKHSDSHIQNLHQFSKILSEERVKRSRARAETRKQQRRIELVINLKQRKAAETLKMQHISERKLSSLDNKNNSAEKFAIDVSDRSILGTFAQDSFHKYRRELVNDFEDTKAATCFKQDKYLSNDNSETYNCINTYYSSGVFKPSKRSFEQMDEVTCDKNLFKTDFSYDMCSKPTDESYKPHPYNVYQRHYASSFKKSYETDYSWKKTTESYAYNILTLPKRGTLVNEDDFPKMVTLLKRKDRNSKTLTQCDREGASRNTSGIFMHDLLEPDERKSKNISHSCTPWEKMKRLKDKEHEQK